LVVLATTHSWLEIGSSPASRLHDWSSPNISESTVPTLRLVSGRGAGCQCRGLDTLFMKNSTQGTRSPCSEAQPGEHTLQDEYWRPRGLHLPPAIHTAPPHTPDK
jgi:hypothetical protein